MNKHFYLLLFTLLFSSCISAQLLRGPYLQKQTSSSMNVKWRTATMTSGKVYYGTDLNNLNLSATDTVNVNDHDVEVKGLQPFTKYFYKIESDNVVLSGPDSVHFFRTAPIPGAVQPIRVWAIGDHGKANDPQRRTRDSYLNYTGKRETDVWLWLGDNVYNDGTDKEYQDKVFETYYGYNEIFKNMHFYPCPGNHDYGSVCPIPCQKDPNTHTGPYYDIISVHAKGEAGGTPSDKELYYSYDYGNVHFISLNSELGSPTEAYDWIGAFVSGKPANYPMVKWLKQDLTNNTQPWVIVYWHQPPFSKGSHDSDKVWELFMKAMRQNILPILDSFGVDMVINGHSHNYERSYMIKGHYGISNTYKSADHLVNGTSGKEALGEAYIKYTDQPKQNNGIVYVVCGNAGSQASDPTFPHPVMFYSDGGDGVHGSFVMDIEGNKLIGRYLTAEGQIKDEFTIIKQTSTGLEKGNNFFKNVSEVTIAPNPFSNNTQIQYSLKKEAQMKIDVYSIEGRLIKTVFSGIQNSGSQSVALDAAGMANGKYILRLTEGKSSVYERVIKLD